MADAFSSTTLTVFAGLPCGIMRDDSHQNVVNRDRVSPVRPFTPY